MDGPLHETGKTEWSVLYRVGGLSALAAAAIETAAVFLSMVFAGVIASPAPGAVREWFTLLHNHRFAGLVYLGILDLAAIALMSMMFLALYVVLRRDHESSAAIGACLAFLGIAVYLATSTVVPMVSLSDRYAAAATDAQKALFLAAGHAVLAVGGVGTGAYMAFLLMGASGLVFSVVMLRTSVFNRVAAYMGILANVATLAYYVASLAVPAMSLFLLWVSGLLFLIWMILVGYRLLN
jgi:hypothetical protein